MERPSKTCWEVCEQVAKMLLPDIIEWAGPTYRSWMYEELMDALSTNSGRRLWTKCEWTSKNIADWLQKAYQWNVDNKLLTILEQIPQLATKAYEEVLSWWILKEQIKPQYSRGDHVQLKLKHLHGIIDSIDLLRAEYHINIDTIKETTGGGLRYKYTVVPFENVISRYNEV